MGANWAAVFLLLLLGIFVALSFGGILYALFSLQSALRTAQADKENAIAVAKEAVVAQQRTEHSLAAARHEFAEFCKKPVVMTVTNEQMDQMSRYVAGSVVAALPPPERIDPKKVQ